MTSNTRYFIFEIKSSIKDIREPVKPFAYVFQFHYTQNEAQLLNHSSVVVHRLHIVILIKQIQDTIQFLDIILSSKFYPGLRDHGYVGLHHWDVLGLKGFADCAEIIRSSDHLITYALCHNPSIIQSFVQSLCNDPYRPKTKLGNGCHGRKGGNRADTQRQSRNLQS